MMARRLVLSLVLLTLVGNASVFAGPNASGKTQAFDLVSLKLETVGPLTRILIETSAPPLYTIFRPTDRLIVVDLPGAEASRLASQYSVKSPVVESIMVHQSHAGRAVARIEVGVQAGARDRSSVKGNTLVIEISPDGKAAPSDLTRGLTRGLTKDTGAEAKKDVKPASLKPADPRTALPGVTVYSAPLAPMSSKSSPAATEPAPEKVTPKPSDLKPATLIRAVRSEAADGAVRIVVDTDGVAQYKDFVLPDPWRIVIDVTGVRSAFGNKTTVVGAALVDRFRVGQPSTNVVRIVLDTKSKVSYHVVREGQSLVITVGNGGTSYRKNTKPQADAKAQNTTATNNVVKEAAAPQHKPEVKVAGDRIENKSADTKADPTAKDAIVPSNLLAQANTQSSGQRVSPQPNRSLPLPTQPAPPTSSAKPLGTQSSQPSVTRSALDVQRPSQVNPGAQAQKRADLAFCDPAFVGGLISFDLRAGVDIRDMLRFISQQYGVNFIVDKSVTQVPVDIRVTDRPWNLVMDSVMRANRLGAVCDNTGIIRIATLAAVKEEEEQTRAIAEEKAKQVPLVTKIIHLKYARAAGALGSGGGGASGHGGSGGGGGGMSGGGASGQGSLMSIVNTRLSPRGRIETDLRTNSLIVTDLPEYTQVIEEMIARLDRAEPQVEIETRIVIASRNFLRDIGSELAGANIGTNGRGGMAQTSGQQFTGGSLQQGSASGGGSGASSGSSSGSGSGSGSASATTKGLGPNLIGPFADNSLRAVANSVLSLTTGPIGTGILSMALSASETKGQIRTIASPRVTTTDNKTAEIVNGVQIPVQTVSNNTITTTFVTAALRLEITPQIIEENGQVLMHVVAENNSVDFGLANQFNNGTPGIDTQSVQSTVLVADGGTTVMGGINIDSEGHTVNRTPGISRIPLLGELFKHRSTRRDSNEILFFVTPRIVRNDGTMGPRLPQRSSVEGMPNPNAQQGAAVAPAPAAKDSKSDPKAAQVAPATTAVVPGKGGQ